MQISGCLGLGGEGEGMGVIKLWVSLGVMKCSKIY